MPRSFRVLYIVCMTSRDLEMPDIDGSISYAHECYTCSPNWRNWNRKSATCKTSKKSTTMHPDFLRQLLLETGTRWWFQIFFKIFTPIWGRFPFWRSYFSDGLKPPTREPFFIIFFGPTSWPTTAKSQVILHGEGTWRSMLLGRMAGGRMWQDAIRMWQDLIWFKYCWWLKSGKLTSWGW